MKMLPYAFSALFLLGISCDFCSQVTFEDHFEGDSLNMEYWSYEEGDGCPNLCGWGNDERQVYSRDYISVEEQTW